MTAVYFESYLPILSALCRAEAHPADSLLRSLYEMKEEGEEDREDQDVEETLQAYGLEKSFEVSVQQEEQQETALH